MILSYNASLLEIQTEGNWDEFWFKSVSELTHIFKISLGTNKCFLTAHTCSCTRNKLTKQIHELQPLIFPYARHPYPLLAEYHIYVNVSKWLQCHSILVSP
jgi:hypothetical protein